MVILARTKVKDAVEKYPELKEILLSLSPKFKLLNNDAVFKMVSKWATFGDVARIGGLSICELLHEINATIGTEEDLLKHAPECITEKEKQPELPAKHPDWMQEARGLVLMDVRNRDNFFFPEVLGHLTGLKEGQILKVVNAFYPAPLIEMLKEEGYDIFYESPSFHEHILYVRGRGRLVEGSWQEMKEWFPLLDATVWGKDFFPMLIQEAESVLPGSGFRLELRMPPGPVVNTVETLGFESFVEEKRQGEYALYFYRSVGKVEGAPAVMHRVPLVIQSATPVVYPIIMRMLESKRLMREIKVEELKIWDKTEKHLGWIVNRKADISFSAVAAVAKLYQKGLDIKMTSIVVWDNFFILTRGLVARDFSGLKGHDIYLPLIKAAPPYAVTIFLMQKLEYDPADFRFVFGKPFGRPEEIKDKLMHGEADVALLREPEASFAIHEGKGDIRESMAYRDIWEKMFPGQGNLPNAGILFKGEVLRSYPDLSEMFLEEAADAVQWVNGNQSEAAMMVADLMGVSQEEAEFFLSRVHLEAKPSKVVLDHVMHYIDVLNKAGYGGKPFGEIRSLFD